MPLRRLTARDRSPAANWQLAAVLAFTAGTVDVSSYLSLRQFTSHMSGIVSGLAVGFAGQDARNFIWPSTVLISFLAGAAFCALLVNWERRRKLEGIYALPVLIEALLLALIALPPARRHPLLTLSCLGFAMGLQNAIITKISHSEIRTTHVTGMVTDIGIELGKAFYWNRSPAYPLITANRKRLLLLTMLVFLFFVGGALGAFAYTHIGFLDLLPLAALLALLTLFPLSTDLRSLRSVRSEH